MKTSKRQLLVPALAALSLACAGEKSAARAPAPPRDIPVASVPAATTPDAPFRAGKPESLSGALAFEAPVPVQRKLKNGIMVLVRENHAIPLVVVEVAVRTGVNGEPESKAGLSEFTASMLTEGTKTRGPLEIATALEDLAANLYAAAGLEATRVHLNCLTETLPSALDVLADVVQHPAFKAADIERLRGQKLTGLEQKNGYPGAIAADQLARLLYGNKHPWGKPAGGTPKSIASITAKDLAGFHAAWFHPDNTLITLSGDVTAEQAVQLLEQKFGGWKGKARAKVKLPATPGLKERVLVVVERPNQSQSAVFFAAPLFPAASPDAVTMQVANSIIGGLFGSRLNLNLREDKGYSYGVRSSVALTHDDGTFIASGGIIAKNTVEAAAEMKKELERFGSGEVTEAELAQAKEGAVRSLPSALETNDAVASALNGLVVKGLPFDYYATLPARVAAVTPAEVKRVVAKYLGTTPWQTVIVGPVGPMEAGLEGLGLGKVQKVALEGAK